jgi:uncharacterized OB-fold protein
VSNLPAIPVSPTIEISQYWEAAGRDVLLVPRCNACGKAYWYPRGFCPFCHSTDIAWEESPGGASIYSFTVAERGMGPWEAAAPYVVAYVELDEGPRVMTNIVDCDPAALSIGSRVTAIFETSGEYKILRFTPAS